LQGRGDRLRLLPIPIDELFQQAQLHRERHDLLLGAIVEIPLELSPLLVLRGDQALS
jgi:hypothetical protein